MRVSEYSVRCSKPSPKTRWNGCSSAEEITLFKSLGCALEDLVAASLVAEALGSGKG